MGKLVTKKAIPAEAGVVYSTEDVLEWISAQTGPIMYINDRRKDTVIGCKKGNVRAAMRRAGYPEYFTFRFSEEGKLEVLKT